MFELSKELLNQVKVSLQNPLAPAMLGPRLYFSACGGGTCRGSCSNLCTGLCTRGCRGVGKGH